MGKGELGEEVSLAVSGSQMMELGGILLRKSSKKVNPIR